MTALLFMLFAWVGMAAGLWFAWHWYDVLDNEWDKD